ncbi:MAG: glycosyltransferase family 4 protein [Bacteroidales bacterium]|jgi:glycosyltransferase involved in cell wall biosynthesis|nr:glycosyltransferase family 4 protein [Bacteroidales bacterium]
MKIAIIGIKGVPGKHGVEVVVDSLLPHLAEIGHEITVYGYDSYTEKADNYQGAKIRTVPGSSSKNTEMISHMWNASWDARRQNFDIVHIHNTDPCLLAWLPKTKYGIVATSHGQAYVRKKWGFAARTMSKCAERFFMHFPDVITSVSRPLADFYENKYGKKVIYIPNGIKFRDKPDPGILKKWDLEAGNYFFCSAGRIERTKGLDTLLQGYEQLASDVPLVIAGGGSGSDIEYFERLKNKKIRGVRFVGFLTGDELFCLYAYPKVFIFPSEYEAMSMALLEGLSFGTPTVYSSIPENDAVAKGLAYSFVAADANSLATAINAVLASYTRAKAMGEKARQQIQEKHNWKTIARQYDCIYEKMQRR